MSWAGFMEKLGGNSSVDLSESPRDFTHILALRKRAWHSTTVPEGLITQQPHYHVGLFDLAFTLEITTPQL